MSDTNYGINSAFSQIGAASSDVIRSRYWDPYLDVASRVLPKDLKSVWNMSLYYAMSHPIIAPLIHKKSTYVVTRPIYETTDSETRQRYTEVMERVLKIREFLAAFNMDYNTFGNAYASVGFPFIKILKCRSCGHVVPAEQIDYKIEGLEFIMPRCPKCFKRTRVDVKDVYYRTTRGMRLIRWNPQHVIVEENPVNGHCTYYLRPPPALENALRVGRKSIINNTPQELIDAIRKKRDLRFDSGQRMPGGAVFASKRLGPSNSTYRGYGIPLIMPALKDAFLMQIMRKAQECVGPKTLVDVEGKLTPAIDVNVGDIVRTHLGTFEPVTKKQIRPMNPATDWGVSLTTSTMPAFPGEYSDNHPVWKLFDGVFDFADASKVKLNDYVGFPINTPQDCNEVCLQGKSYPLTSELAYAAGWLTRNALPNLEVMETLSQYPEDAVTDWIELEQPISPMITNAPLTYQLDFLRGYTEAAGYYPEAGAAPLQIYSPALAYQLWVMLVSVGCIPTLMANKHGFRLVIPADSMHHLQGLWEGEVPEGSRVHGNKDAFFCGDYLCSRVTSAQVVDLPEVISFEVAGTHTFCTAGVATHNSIMFEHIVPMRFAFPVNSMDLAQSIDLSDLQQNIAMQLREWRRDQNRVIVFPVQVVLDELGARGRALLLNPEIRQQAEMISIAMGFPPEFLMGGVSYSGSNVSLRIVENDLLFNFADNEDLLQYIANQVAWFMGWPTVQLRQKPFKMADDLQRAAFDANLTAQQMLSKSTLLQSRDYDPDTELEQVRKEIPIFGELTQQQTIMQARAQGAANLIGAQYGVQAAKIQSQGQGGPPVPAQMPPRATDDEGNELPPNDAAIMNAEQAISAYESPLAPGVMGMIPSEYANYVFDQISGLDPAEQTQAMQQVYTQSPGIASTVASMLAEKNMLQAASGRPLPEQLPPRRGPAKALI